MAALSIELKINAHLILYTIDEKIAHHVNYRKCVWDEIWLTDRENMSIRNLTRNNAQINCNIRDCHYKCNWQKLIAIESKLFGRIYGRAIYVCANVFGRIRECSQNFTFFPHISLHKKSYSNQVMDQLKSPFVN